MTVAPDHVLRWRGFDVARWSFCALLVLGVHAGAAAYVLTHQSVTSSAEPPAAIVIDLSPVVAAPATETAEIPPGPEMVQTNEPPKETAEKTEEEETPLETVKAPEPEPEAPPAPTPEVAVTQLREPEPPPPVEVKPVETKPVEKPKPIPPKPPRKRAAATTAPQRVPQVARQQTAPVAAASLAPSNAMPAWRSMVSAILERSKRTLAGARPGVRGTAAVSFSVGRNGQLLSVNLSRSSGDSLFDQEAVALVRRAGSFPPPPAGELRGSSVAMTVPIHFEGR